MYDVAGFSTSARSKRQKAYKRPTKGPVFRDIFRATTGNSLMRMTRTLALRVKERIRA